MPLTDDQKEVLALDLKKQVLQLLNGNSHQVVLTALLNAYLDVATEHHCCAQNAANSAMQASMLLAQVAASTRHPIH